MQKNYSAFLVRGGGFIIACVGISCSRLCHGKCFGAFPLNQDQTAWHECLFSSNKSPVISSICAYICVFCCVSLSLSTQIGRRALHWHLGSYELRLEHAYQSLCWTRVQDGCHGWIYLLHCTLGYAVLLFLLRA